MSAGKIRSTLRGNGELPRRFRVAAQTPEDVAEFHARAQIVGSQSKRLLERSGGAVELAEIAQHETEAYVSFREGGPELNGGREARCGFGGLVLIAEDKRKIVVGDGESGIQFDRAIQSGAGFG